MLLNNINIKYNKFSKLFGFPKDINRKLIIPFYECKNLNKYNFYC